jgi:hypothetical protein
MWYGGRDRIAVLRIWKGRNKDLSSMPRARGYKPEWVQANEMLRMRAVKNTRWMWGLPFTPKALP